MKKLLKRKSASSKKQRPTAKVGGLTKRVQPTKRRASKEDSQARFSVRGPKSLHEALMKLAAKEGSTLNQVVLRSLSEAVKRTR